jgi:hypothetical protein
VADTADRRPIQQVAEMSAPHTCSDRVRGCPAVVDSDLGEGVDAGRPCVVTGGGRGIGRVLVKRLARDPEEMITGVPVTGHMRQARL